VYTSAIVFEGGATDPDKARFAALYDNVMAGNKNYPIEEYHFGWHFVNIKFRSLSTTGNEKKLVSELWTRMCRTDPQKCGQAMQYPFSYSSEISMRGMSTATPFLAGYSKPDKLRFDDLYNNVKVDNKDYDIEEYRWGWSYVTKTLFLSNSDIFTTNETATKWTYICLCHPHKCGQAIESS